MSEDRCCPYDWPILRVQLYFSGLSSFCLLVQYLFPERKQQINFASLYSLHIFRDFLQNSLRCSTLFIWKVVGTWSIIRSLTGIIFAYNLPSLLGEKPQIKGRWAALELVSHVRLCPLCRSHQQLTEGFRNLLMFYERNPHPQALLQDTPRFAARTLLPDHVSQLICSSFFQHQNPGGKKSFLHLSICV